MKVTDVAIQLAPQGQDRLRGFCCITLDGSFVVRDIKIINGPNGLFVAMPSRKIMASCPGCRTKNHLHRRFSICALHVRSARCAQITPLQVNESRCIATLHIPSTLNAGR